MQKETYISCMLRHPLQRLLNILVLDCAAAISRFFKIIFEKNKIVKWQQET